MKKLLVTGASGFLGWNICRMAKSAWEVYGTVFSHPLEIQDVTVRRVDLTDFKQLKSLFRELRPDAVIHSAATTNPSFCQVNKTESRRINVHASVNIAGLCADHSIACAFISSDLVFDGLKAPYRESDTVCPISIYGEQKVEAEREMAERHHALTICRMPLMFGSPGPAGQSFIQPMMAAMREGRELKLFTDEFRTPVSGETAAAGIFIALKAATDIIHLGGIERISRYNMGKLLADVLGVENPRLTPCLQRDVPMAAPRPPDVSFDSTRAFGLGFRPEPIRNEIEKFLLSEAAKR
ncbi:MAG: SDR family oxidoreductase [Syntrophobacteraceae bacterium]